MIDITTKSSPASANYFIKHQSINSLTHQVSDRLIYQEKFQFTADQVYLTFNSESVTVYDRSVFMANGAESGKNLLKNLVLKVFMDQGIDSHIATDGSVKLDDWAGSANVMSPQSQTQVKS